MKMIQILFMLMNVGNPLMSNVIGDSSGNIDNEYCKDERLKVIGEGKKVELYDVN